MSTFKTSTASHNIWQPLTHFPETVKKIRGGGKLNDADFALVRQTCQARLRKLASILEPMMNGNKAYEEARDVTSHLNNMRKAIYKEKAAKTEASLRKELQRTLQTSKETQQTEMSRLEDRNQKLAGELQVSKTLTTKQKTEIGKLEAEARSSSDEVHRLNKELSSQRDNILQLEKTLKGSRASQQRCEDEATKLQKDLSASQKDGKVLQEQSASYKDEVIMFKTALKESELQNKQHEIDRLGKLIESYDADAMKFNDEMKSREDEAAKREGLVQQYRDQIARLSSNLRSCKGKVDKLDEETRTRTNRAEGLNKALRQSQNEISQLNSEVQLYKGKVEGLDEALKQSETAKQLYETNVNALESSLLAHQSEAKDLQGTLQSKDEAVQMSEATAQSLESEVNRLSHELEAIQNEVVSIDVARKSKENQGTQTEDIMQRCRGSQTHPADLDQINMRLIKLADPILKTTSSSETVSFYHQIFILLISWRCFVLLRRTLGQQFKMEWSWNGRHTIDAQRKTADNEDSGSDKTHVDSQDSTNTQPTIDDAQNHERHRGQTHPALNSVQQHRRHEPHNRSILNNSQDSQHLDALTRSAIAKVEQHNADQTNFNAQQNQAGGPHDVKRKASNTHGTQSDHTSVILQAMARKIQQLEQQL
ncbi:hypothetical protein MMC10_004047 [Thelotrema lepadinum]|nr:hypothetical protein [Thelotrema lepadinum]